MTQTTEPATKLQVHHEPEQEHCYAFLTAIQELYETDKGKIAALKRNAGNTLAEARGLAWFEYYLLRHMRGQSRRRDNLCLLVASLMAFDRNTLLHGVKRSKRDFGATLAALRSPEERKSARPGQTPLERRLVILLDAMFDEEGGGEMAYRLHQAVKFTLSKDKDRPIDWPQLLQDMFDWGHPGKRVQKHWARSFYAVPNEAIPPSTEREAPNPTL